MIIVIRPKICRMLLDADDGLFDLVPECDEHMSARVVIYNNEDKVRLKCALVSLAREERVTSRVLGVGTRSLYQQHRRVALDCERLVETLDKGRGSKI